LAAGWARTTRRASRFQPLEDGCEPETTPKGYVRQAETARNSPYFLAIPQGCMSHPERKKTGAELTKPCTRKIAAR
jgi:hypothetical protein